ncbi:MAG: glutamine-hydrolyzing GMP synthase [Bacteroidales bacterium]|jgi:GMP synthase (glutamine-hydrolysing)|nr:glutamine-hydrolyzing GMP synthase [Bacteroidales bacterium]
MQETILILDFGSQYTQLIARRIRELNVYCEIYPFHHFPVPDDRVKGVILSGSPFSIRDENAPIPDLKDIRGKIPVLGICYGAQYLAQFSGGEVAPSKIREYGRSNLTYLDSRSTLLKGMSTGTQVWMSHADTILTIPSGFHTIASTPDVKFAGFHIAAESTYGIQFHPEVYHTTEGLTLLGNFVADICGCSQSWTPQSFVETTVAELKNKIGNDKVILGLSGGVDSSVTAMLLHKAIGKNLYCIFVDNGLLRKNEFRNVLERYKRLDLNVTGVDAGDLFIDGLKKVFDPEKKRKIIGKTFIDVFEAEAHKIRDIQWLAQGTIYPDVIESHSVKGPSATIKSHHNVGGLPDHLKLKIVEPLNTLFKDEVRKVGKALGLDDEFLKRHPFPGPGLAVRILSDIDREKVRLLQEVDDIFIAALRSYNLYHEVWQAFAVLLPVQTVGVMGDERTYENVVALRAVTSTDGMTADWAHLPHDFLAKVSNDIINKVKGVNRVVYDISSKPPATIEWE